MAKVMARTGSWKLEIVKRSDRQRFVVLPKRWIVERIPGQARDRLFARTSRYRRLLRDFERHADAVAAFFFRLAIICLMLRRLTQAKPSQRFDTSWIGTYRRTAGRAVFTLLATSLWAPTRT